jgi:hypothetical protein
VCLGRPQRYHQAINVSAVAATVRSRLREHLAMTSLPTSDRAILPGHYYRRDAPGWSEQMVTGYEADRPEEQLTAEPGPGSAVRHPLARQVHRLKSINRWPGSSPARMLT